MFGATGGRLGLAVAVALGAAMPAGAHGTTERVSVGPRGVQGNGESVQPAISADGRFVAFHSIAGNLVPGDPHRNDDVFVRDRKMDVTQQISVGPGSADSDSRSFSPALSANGRFVAFTSNATDLVPGGTNGQSQVFVRDRQRGTIRRVSLGPGGTQGKSTSGNPAISANGRFVAFDSFATDLVPGDANGVFDVFVRDRWTGTTTRVSIGPRGVQGNGDSFLPAISADGRFVAFQSDATNLARGDTNGVTDVFVRDRKLGTTRRVSVAPGGAEGNGISQKPAISADGHIVAFSSLAANLVPGDTNGSEDVFVRVLTS